MNIHTRHMLNMNYSYRDNILCPYVFIFCNDTGILDGL